MSRTGHVEIAELTPEDLLGTLNDVERKNAPPRLFVAGDRSVFQSGPRIAVVGSRAASEEGLRRAKVIAARLAERQMVVVSGLAAPSRAERASAASCRTTIASRRSLS